MELVNTAELKKIKEARLIIDRLQERLYEVEMSLDDLARASEIARYSKQFEIVEGFCERAGELLKDRLVVPEPPTKEGPLDITVVTGTVDESLIKG